VTVWVVSVWVVSVWVVSVRVVSVRVVRVRVVTVRVVTVTLLFKSRIQSRLIFFQIARRARFFCAPLCLLQAATGPPMGMPYVSVQLVEINELVARSICW